MYKTREEIDTYCEKFQPGDRVLIPETVKEEEGKKNITIKTEGTVIARYPYFLLIARGKFKECFLYSDIATSGTVEKKRGRKQNGSEKQ